MIEMKKNLMKSTILLIGFISFSVFASSTGISGTWETIDDRTGQKKAIVQLYEKDGKIEKVTKKVSGKWKEINLPASSQKVLLNKCSN